MTDTAAAVDFAAEARECRSWAFAYRGTPLALRLLCAAEALEAAAKQGPTMVPRDISIIDVARATIQQWADELKPELSRPEYCHGVMMGLRDASRLLGMVARSAREHSGDPETFKKSAADVADGRVTSIEEVIAQGMQQWLSGNSTIAPDFMPNEQADSIASLTAERDAALEDVERLKAAMHRIHVRAKAQPTHICDVADYDLRWIAADAARALGVLGLRKEPTKAPLLIAETGVGTHAFRRRGAYWESRQADGVLWTLDSADLAPEDIDRERSDPEAVRIYEADMAKYSPTPAAEPQKEA